jgi:DNA-binding MurR/RpiR family transcriptional regulator
VCNFLPVDQKKQVNEELRNAQRDDKKTIKQIYRKYIQNNRETLMQIDNERVAEMARYININPRILLIFDDCIASGHKVINQSIQ